MFSPLAGVVLHIHPQPYQCAPVEEGDPVIVSMFGKAMRFPHVKSVHKQPWLSVNKKGVDGCL